MKAHGKTLNTYSQVTEVHLKRLFTVWFKLYDILENKTMDTVKRLVVNGVGRKGGLNKQIFRRAKLSCMILKWWIHLTFLHLPNPIEYTTARVSMGDNDVSVQVHPLQNVSFWWKMLIVWGVWAGNSLYFLFSFVVNLQLLWKIMSIRTNTPNSFVQIQDLIVSLASSWPPFHCFLLIHMGVIMFYSIEL